MYESPFIPRILYNSPPGYAARAAEIGINVLLWNDFSRRTWTQREAALQQVEKYGLKMMPWVAGVASYDDPNIYDFWEGKKPFILKYKDDDRIYGWFLLDEPDIGKDVPVEEYIKRLYNTVRTYDPGGKPCLITWDQWDAHGYRCQAGEFDIFAFDTWASGDSDIQKFRNIFNYLDRYYHFRDIGKPAIAHFYKYEALEECYRAWEELVPAGVVGTMYYNAAIVMANTPEGATIRAAIEAFHRSMGWWPPPEEFTTQEITCSGCSAGLELTISSIPENNISQGCPVCGTPAD